MKITWLLQPRRGTMFARGVGGISTPTFYSDVGDRLIEQGKSFHGKTWKQLVALAKKPGYFQEEVPDPTLPRRAPHQTGASRKTKPPATPPPKAAKKKPA